MSDYEPDYAASQALLPVAAAVPQPKYALVEIFGHRTHWGEVREVEAFGTKLLEVADGDTGKLHRYGGASIFSLTNLTAEEYEAHLADVRARRLRDAEYEARWKREREERMAREKAGLAVYEEELPL